MANGSHRIASHHVACGWAALAGIGSQVRVERLVATRLWAAAARITSHRIASDRLQRLDAWMACMLRLLAAVASRASRLAELTCKDGPNLRENGLEARRAGHFARDAVDEVRARAPAPYPRPSRRSREDATC